MNYNSGCFTDKIKVVVAFDSFKGCLTAEEACNAAADGVCSLFPNADVVKVPLSDGGEGLVACVKRMLPTEERKLNVHGPLMEEEPCSYALSSDKKTAYMEMAAASGLTLVAKEKRRPLEATSYGVGEMIADAIGLGCERIVIGLGGSATTDAGEGMLEALRKHGCYPAKCRFTVACDVKNPLYGKNGAAYVFAPQKGADARQVFELDNRLREFARRTEQAGLASADAAGYPGAGAAGGLGYAFLVYLKAELRPGIDVALDFVEFEKLIRHADVVITGEGCSDRQTMMGKVASGVQKRCRKAGVPVWLLSGAVDDADNMLFRHFDLVRSINENDTRPVDVLMKKDVAKENLYKTVRTIFLSEKKVWKSQKQRS